MAPPTPLQPAGTGEQGSQLPGLISWSAFLRFISSLAFLVRGWGNLPRTAGLVEDNF